MSTKGLTYYPTHLRKPLEQRLIWVIERCQRRLADFNLRDDDRANNEAQLHETRLKLIALKMKRLTA